MSDQEISADDGVIRLENEIQTDEKSISHDAQPDANFAVLKAQLQIAGESGVLGAHGLGSRIDGNQRTGTPDSTYGPQSPGGGTPELISPTTTAPLGFDHDSLRTLSTTDILRHSNSNYKTFDLAPEEGFAASSSNFQNSESDENGQPYTEGHDAAIPRLSPSRQKIPERISPNGFDFNDGGVRGTTQRVSANPQANDVNERQLRESQRPASFSTLPRPNAAVLNRRGSLPVITRSESAQTQPFRAALLSLDRDLILPDPLPVLSYLSSPMVTRAETPQPPVNPLSQPTKRRLVLRDPLPMTPRRPKKLQKKQNSRPNGTTEALAAATINVVTATANTERPERVKDDSRKPDVWYRTTNSLMATYAPRETPPLILPSAPTDEEKVGFLKTNRFGLYSFGVFSFLSLSAGMWLFVISAIPFYWFGLVVILLQTYLVISYIVSVVGKDFDFEAHKKILEEYPIVDNTAPTVDIYLPCCKEPIEVLENTYKHVQLLKWPANKLEVHVLDDGASDIVEALAARYNFHYMSRDDRPRLKKAGNLRWAFARTSAQFFTIYDADFCPRPDFLLEIIPHHLAHPQTAIVQTPQYFRTSTEQTWVEQGAGSVQELFYRVIQVNRNRWGASICVGSNAIYRREALVEVGGTAEIGFSEDVHTGFYALTRGWQIRYVPLCLACGICPDTPRAFFSQQMRWCMGSTTLLTNPEFWVSSLTLVQKICYLSGMMYYSAISLSIFLNPLPGILMIWVRPDYVRFYNLAFAVPSLLYSFIAIRLWAKSSYGINVQFIMVIQTYAYFTAIKDRLFGRGLAWVPSGDTKAHKNHKYRNMRILAWCWMSTVMGTLISGVAFRVLRGLPWYDCLPVLMLDTFNLFVAHRFLFCHGKL